MSDLAESTSGTFPPVAAENEREAIAFLKAEHRSIDEGFALYFTEPQERRWSKVMSRTLTALKIHMELEEEIFYPQYLAVAQQEDRFHESMVEHEVEKKLIADLEHSDPGDHQFYAMVKILWKIASRHFAEEEGPGGVFSCSLTVSQDAHMAKALATRHQELLESFAVAHSPSRWPKQAPF